MGHKVNPNAIRLGVNRTWDSRWFAEGDEYVKLLHDDFKIRQEVSDFLTKRYGSDRQAGISKIVIERPAKRARVTIYSARPGIIIGKKGADIEKLRNHLQHVVGSEVVLNIHEIRRPDIDSRLVAESIAQQLERRGSFRRALKRAVQNAMRQGAYGIRINAAGRLGGAEIARTEWYREGRVPLHTIRADIDYAHAEALTTYGIIGIKCWIYKGDILEHDPMASEKRAMGSGAAR